MSGIDLPGLVERYGYAAVFVGALFEGETMLILGGLFAHRGYLELPMVMATAFIGGIIGDQFFFWLGRRHGDAALRRLRAPAAPVERVKRLLERSAPFAIVANRFLYGLRAIGPIMIAMSGVSPGRFAFYNVIGSAVWATLIAGGGYLFAHAMQAVLGSLHHIEKILVIAVFCVGIAGWIFMRRRGRRGSQ